MHREPEVDKVSDDGGKLISTVDRATDVLSLFAEHSEGTLGVTEIAKQLGLSKAVVHRILSTLASKGYVQLDRDSRRYSLGPQVLVLGLTYLDRIDIRRLAAPEMRRLVAVTGETSTLSIRTGWSRVYVDQVTPHNDIRMSVQLGHPYPLHAGSSSKALLAFLPEAEREEYLDRPLEAVTDRTLTDADVLRRELARIRELGYARSISERQLGAASVAAAILDHRGRPAATLSVCGPMERFAEHIDGAAAELLQSAAGVSALLGHDRARVQTVA
jgi:DNA-binding IclR family transcriptional regulator